ncbi:hypothetical protein [Halocatena halophila]
MSQRTPPNILVTGASDATGWEVLERLREMIVSKRTATVARHHGEDPWLD